MVGDPGPPEIAGFAQLAGPSGAGIRERDLPLLAETEHRLPRDCATPLRRVDLPPDPQELRLGLHRLWRRGRRPRPQESMVSYFATSAVTVSAETSPGPSPRMARTLIPAPHPVVVSLLPGAPTAAADITAESPAAPTASSRNSAENRSSGAATCTVGGSNGVQADDEHVNGPVDQNVMQTSPLEGGAGGGPISRGQPRPTVRGRSRWLLLGGPGSSSRARSPGGGPASSVPLGSVISRRPPIDSLGARSRRGPDGLKGAPSPPERSTAFRVEATTPPPLVLFGPPDPSSSRGK